VVESAEDWQQRVREALAEGSGESSETLKALKSLLDEADDLPVCMAEAGLLAEELQQRQWTVEARALLDAGAPHAKLTVLKRKLGEAEEIREIRYERLEKKKRAAGVVGGGRGGRPGRASPVENPWTPEEEGELKRVVKAADAWISRAKKAAKGTGAGGGADVLGPRVSMGEVKTMLEAGAGIRVDLRDHRGGLEEMMEAANAWSGEAAALLSDVEARCGRFRAAIAAAKDGAGGGEKGEKGKGGRGKGGRGKGGKGGGDVEMAEAGAADDEGAAAAAAELEPEDRRVALSTLIDMLESGSALGVKVR
jgi:hypothetical protein